MASTKGDPRRLEIRHRMSVPRREAFSWWSEPGKLQQWSGCADAVRCEINMDFRVGGSFRQTMEIKDRGTFTFHGVYEEIVVPERISWRAHIGTMTTKVVVEFIDLGDETEVILVQEGFPSEESLKTISQGSRESFDALDAVLSKDSAKRTVEAKL
jgi:uncharacterized protein YndB with AHSA1/START domain